MAEHENRQNEKALKLRRLDIPVYLEGDYGPWRIERVIKPGNQWGYATGPKDEARYSRLLNVNRQIASTSRAAIEAHALAVESARGVVVLMGLKMGLVLHNIAKKEEVTQVFAVDADPDIIKMIEGHADEMKWPGMDKVHFVQSVPQEFDRKTLSSYGARDVPDFFYADLWAGFELEGNSLSEINTRTTRLLAGPLQPMTVGFWGQELAFIDYCMTVAVPPVTRGDQLNLDHFDSWCLKSDMNLQHRSNDYIQHCLVCWTNNNQRREWERGGEI